MTARPHLPLPRPRSGLERLLSASSTIVRVFVVLILIGWILSVGNIHNLSTQQPDTIHTFPVHQHGDLFYTHPVLGRIYVNFPWLVAGSLLVAFLMDYIMKKMKTQYGKGP